MASEPTPIVRAIHLQQDPPPDSDEPLTVPDALQVTAAVAWRLLVVLVAAGVVLYLLVLLRLVTVPIILAMFVATLLYSPARWLRARGVPRGFAAALVVLLALLVAAGAIALIVPPIVSQVGNVGTSLSQGALAAGQLFGVPQPQAEVDRLVGSVVAYLQDQLVTGLFVSGEVLAGFLLMVAILFLFLRDGERIWEWLVGLLPVRAQDEAKDGGAITWQTLRQYVRGTALVAVIETVLVSLTLLVVGVPLVLPLALLVFLGAFFPLVGILVAGAAATLVTLVSSGPGPAAFVAAAIALVHVLEGNVLFPFIAGRTLRLHALAILLAITAGSVLAGPFGAFLSIPLTASAYATLSYLRSEERAASQAA